MKNYNKQNSLGIGSPGGFLPATRDEMKAAGWKQCDVIIVTGDAYIDSPYIGAAAIGRWLEAHGFKVGIIAQPDTSKPDDIKRLGEPRLFWGVTGGSVDSMVANYTAQKKKRRNDDFTPGGINNRRPDRAVMVYTTLIRTFFKNTVPIVLGGIEASLRRVAHYDFWDNRIRNPILFDSKADYLLYGMAEKSVLELALKLDQGLSADDIRGLCRLGKNVPDGYIELPSAETVKTDKEAFASMFALFFSENDPFTARGLCQKLGDRYMVQNPPSAWETTEELDKMAALPYTLDAHPLYSVLGAVRALDTIRFSIMTHRGCYGGCNFCAIAVHQGMTVRWRSIDSILNEARRFTGLKGWKGIILDAGGPTANMYGYECAKKLSGGICRGRNCLKDGVCPSLPVSHDLQTRLLKELRNIPGVRKVFIGSGIRYDLLLSDKRNGREWLEELAQHHVSGQLKVAPEHSVPGVLQKMGKPDNGALLEFKKRFEQASRLAGKEQYLTYYFIAAHPGCSMKDMDELSRFIRRELRIRPEQVQIFTPTPGTWSTLMYYTEKDPFTGEGLSVEKDFRGREKQKERITPPERQ